MRVLAIIAAALVSLTGGAPGADPPPHTTVARVTFAAVGDSLTNANSVDFSHLGVGDRSWVRYVTPDVAFVGGWARGGAQTPDMVVNAGPVEADVLVVLAGTNDLAHGRSFAAISRDLVAITRKVGVAQVIVAALPPRDSTPATITAFNRRLAVFADARGWTFVDAMGGLRKGEVFAPGMSSDGLHPDRAGAAIMAATLSRAIADAGETRRG